MYSISINFFLSVYELAQLGYSDHFHPARTPRDFPQISLTKLHLQLKQIITKMFTTKHSTPFSPRRDKQFYRTPLRPSARLGFHCFTRVAGTARRVRVIFFPSRTDNTQMTRPPLDERSMRDGRLKNKRLVEMNGRSSERWEITVAIGIAACPCFFSTFLGDIPSMNTNFHRI